MSLLRSIKDFFHRASSLYKDISSRSGGCAYIPPNCLSTPQKTETDVASKESSQSKNEQN